MKKLKTKVTVIITLIVLAIIGTIIFLAYNDESRLNTEEKQWLTTNENTVLSVNVVNNVDIVGNNGVGIFYDFINDIKSDYNLAINPVAVNALDNMGEKSFTMKSKVSSKDLVFFKEHYILISKKNEFLENMESLKDLKIGTINSYEKTIKEYTKEFTTTSYESYEKLAEAFTTGEEINYMILPLQQYLTNIIENDYKVVYHFSDLINYYVYEMPKENDEFSNIVYKYFINWQEKYLEKSTDTNTLKSFVNGLKITTKELADMQAREYNYGFIDNKPYEVLMGGNYGGVVSEYLRNFSNVSNIDFKFRKYDDVNDFNKSLKTIDLYFNYYGSTSEFENIDSGLALNFVLIADKKEDIIVKSLNTLKGKDVYVLKNSLLSKHLETINGINIKYYNNEKELKKIVKKHEIIAIDTINNNYLNNDLLEDYTIRYEGSTKQNYSFMIDESDAFIRLFSSYVNTLEPNEQIINGIYSSAITVENGNTVFNVARYFLLTVAALVLIIFGVYKSSKNIKVSKRIKKEFKVKYIDQLTSLKNRNYLNENMASWNKNTIYPQTTIIVDLNCLQEINDTLGYEHGDIQIKAAANILVKTQLDNSDIMRTDGNEFLIYLIGYQERQIVSYVRKLQKEFKSLPYEHGAAIGYSMITDDIKTVEDAINESVDDMRTKKEEIIGE